MVSNPLKNMSQLGWLFSIYGKIKVMFQATNQTILWDISIIYIIESNQIPINSMNSHQSHRTYSGWWFQHVPGINKSSKIPINPITFIPRPASSSSNCKACVQMPLASQALMAALKVMLFCCTRRLSQQHPGSRGPGWDVPTLVMNQQIDRWIYEYLCVCVIVYDYVFTYRW